VLFFIEVDTPRAPRRITTDLTGAWTTLPLELHDADSQPSGS
jgi:hypothetical protein